MNKRHSEELGKMVDDLARSVTAIDPLGHPQERDNLLGFIDAEVRAAFERGAQAFLQQKQDDKANDKARRARSGGEA